MIERLFTYSENGDPIPHYVIDADMKGLSANRQCHPWRHVLLLPSSTLAEFDLKPSELRENILVSDDIQTLPSGTVIELGNVKVRLTFHCEPCKKLKPLISPNKLLNKRGYLGQVISTGTIRLGDSVVISKQIFAPIPYAIPDRIKWYLNQLTSPIFVTDLVDGIGLSRSYCRAIPNILKGRTDIDASKVRYKSKQLTASR